MKKEYQLVIPYTFGKIVEDYLKTLMQDVEYSAWTINDKLEVVECKGIIANNGSYNYHYNYDNSQNELYIVENKLYIRQWFSLNKQEVIDIQQLNILKWKAILQEELSRIDSLCL